MSYAETFQSQHIDINYASRITMTTTVTLREVARKQEDKNATGRQADEGNKIKRAVTVRQRPREQIKNVCWLKRRGEG